MNAVLLVDDDMNLLRGLRRTLRGQPFEIALANSAEIAMEMFYRSAFDVVVTDQAMGGRTGKALIDWLSEHYPRTVCIMLTGKPDLELMQRAINDGNVFRFLTKPCRELDLAVAIRDALELASLGKSSEKQLLSDS